MPKGLAGTGPPGFILSTNPRDRDREHGIGVVVEQSPRGRGEKERVRGGQREVQMAAEKQSSASSDSVSGWVAQGGQGETCFSFGEPGVVQVATSCGVIE